MKRTHLLWALAAILILAAGIFAGTTGQITGVVTDNKTKEPLPGVTVAVMGTNLGAKTDEEGRYTILNVPVGTYVLRFSSVGFTTVEVSNVSVSVDLASYQDQALGQSVTELQDVIKVTAEQPLLIRDKTSSISVVKKEELEALPVRGLDQVVALQNSVVKTRTFSAMNARGDREAINGSEINLRGGRPSEVAYYVDGFSTQDPLSGNSTARIATSAVQEVSVQAGGFSAEYGGVSSGIINTTTASGGDALTGSIGVQSDNVFEKSANNNVYDATLNGPIPGVDNLHFSLVGERWWIADRTPSSKTHEYLPSGQYGLPVNSSAGWAYSAKLDYGLTPTLKASVSASSSLDEWREYIHSYYFAQNHAPYYEDRNIGLNGRITHTLSAKTFYNVSVSYSQIRRFRGDGLFRKNLYGYENDQNPSFSDATMFWLPGHVYDDFLRRRSEYVGFKGDLTSQVGEFHTVKLGVDAQRHTLRYYRNLTPIQVAQDSSGIFNDIDRYGYDSLGNSSDDAGDNGLDGPKHPVNLGLYAQDRFEWRGMILIAGVRFDYFDYKAKRIKNLDKPFDPDSLPDPLSEVLDDGDLEDSEKFTRLSPRLAVSFPVSDKTKLHFNYGKFYQRPDLQYLYVGYRFYEYKVTNAGYYYPIGNPNLKPEKTTAYEIGFETLLNERTRFSATAFLKDMADQVQVYNRAAFPKSYETYQNSDYGTVRGLELGLEMRRSSNVQIDLKYTLQFAEGTGSYANTARNSAWTDGDAPKQPAPLDYDQRHKLTAIFDWQLGRGQGPIIGDMHPLEFIHLNVLTNISSGTPYSPQEVYDEVTLGNVSPTPAASRNSNYGPGTFTIDLKLSREFKVGRYGIKPYVTVLNVLDRDNVISVYESSGRANSTGYLATTPGKAWAATHNTPGEFGYTGSEEYNLKQQNPTNYSNPRLVFFGVTATF